MMKNKRTLLVLGASQYYVNTIKRIQDYGYRVLVIDRSTESPGFKCADGYAAIDFSDIERTYDYCQREKVDGILALNDYGVPTAASIADRLGLAGIGLEVGKIVTNKAMMRKCWQEKGLPIPGFIIGHSVDEISRNTDCLHFPLIVKPADSRGGGSRGISVAFSKDELANAVEFAQSFYNDDTVVVEECVSGSEHSIEVCVVNGQEYILAVSEKVKTDMPYRVDRKVIYPARLDVDSYNEVARIVKKTVSSIGIENAVCHIELALTKDGPILFEIGARVGGGATPFFVENVYGIDYLKIAVKIAMGEELASTEMVQRFLRGGIYHFFAFDGQGREVVKINGIEQVEKLPGVVECCLFIKEHDFVKSVKIGSDRHGYALIIGDNVDDVMLQSNQIDKCLFLEY